MRLKDLMDLGFDNSYHIPFTKTYRVGCSQCAAVCINGMPCHETGCQNEARARGENESEY